MTSSDELAAREDERVAQWDVIAARIPLADLNPSEVLYRIHRSDRDPIFFSQNGSGRFDPPRSVRSQFGVCYCGASPLTAFIEVFGRTNPVSARLIAERSLTEMRAPRGLRLADLTDRSLLGRVGAIPEISVGPLYQDSQALAARLHAHGADGIIYHARHDPALQLVSIAVFDSAEGGIVATKSQPIPDALIADAESGFGLIVLPDVALG